MRKKALLNPIEMSKSLVTICVLMLLLLLVPCEIFATGKTTRVSVSSAGVQGNDDSSSWGRPSISSDGRYVAFDSDADNLVEGDGNNTEDAFVHDRKTGQTTLVSVSSVGVQANSGSGRASISSDGRYVAFGSIADNLVESDSNNDSDVFVHEMQTGQTSRVSVSSTGVQANNRSYHESISSNGRYVVFLSDADNLVDGDSNNAEDVFVHEMQTGQTTLVSVSSTGVQGAGNHDDHPSISSDGPYVAYSSNADNLVNGDNNNLLDVFVHEMQTGQTTLVSVSSTGVQGNDQSWQPSISADGRYVAFKSNADNLVEGDSNNVGDVFVHEMQTGQTTLVSVSSTGVQGNSHSGRPSISSDGRYVAFRSDADNLVEGDSNNARDVFVHDRQTGQTTRVSVSSAGVQGNNYSWILSISSDGRYVAFTSSADNLVDGDSNNNRDVFVHDRFADEEFADVPPGFWAEEFINKIYEAGITSGCSQNPLMYCPEDPVTRAEMAVFLERGINGSDYSPPDATGIFGDCPVSHWAADWVEQFYADGITSGCSTNPLMYCPDDLVTRAEMAVFLLRSMYGNGYTPPSAVGIFDDVPVTHWAANWIEQLYDEGITGGCSTDPLLYCPDDLVTRAAMAVFIVRAFGL